ncbi:hypothetical protein F7725_001358 [Dissostichus mawsoni]|uniref:ORM1-like protein 2 n=1 Tax=Dissostichus mawsoni TaxID=36200 RepID=A0A7J5ZHK1_DISMA|nr:hypothetical protein F7725_001358 [Dissostichus mawsoni]
MILLRWTRGARLKRNKEFPGELRQHRKMNVGVAHSEVNPNTRVMNSRGIWLTYLLLTVVLHIVLLSIPFFTVPLVWTLTNVIHNLVMYLFMHTVKGTPFETPDQGKARLLTHWEQMDYGFSSLPHANSSPSHLSFCISSPASTRNTTRRIS